MNERLLWIKYDICNRMMHVYMTIAKWATKHAQKMVKTQKDIYFEVTGKEI